MLPARPQSQSQVPSNLIFSQTLLHFYISTFFFKLYKNVQTYLHLHRINIIEQRYDLFQDLLSFKYGDGTSDNIQ